MQKGFALAPETAKFTSLSLSYPLTYSLLTVICTSVSSKKNSLYDLCTNLGDIHKLTNFLHLLPQNEQA